MTKEDIKKALEICTDLDYSCDNCPYDTVRNCNDKLCNDARKIITEQESEIERLDEVVKNYKEVLCETTQRKDDAIEHNDKLVEEYESKIKQVQVNMINTIVKYCENPNHWNELKDCKLFGGRSDDLRDFLNRIFREIENEN